MSGENGQITEKEKKTLSFQEFSLFNTRTKDEIYIHFITEF